MTKKHGPEKTLEKFYERVSKDQASGCWNWVGYVDQDGYGNFYCGKSMGAHRYAYRRFVGPLARILVVDHLCNNKLCVNPEHLKQTTQRENVLRSSGITAANAKKTHCPSGHEYTQANTIFRLDKYGRRCRICTNLQYSRRIEKSGQWWKRTLTNNFI